MHVQSPAMVRFCHLVVAIAVSLAAGVAPAHGSETQFSARSEGSPVATAVGQWIDGGTTARLAVQAANRSGVETRFTALWISSPVTATTNTGFTGSCTVPYLSIDEERLAMGMKLWVRFDGGPWQVLASSNGWIEFSGPDLFILEVDDDVHQDERGSLVEYRWRLRGSMRAAGEMTFVCDTEVGE